MYNKILDLILILQRFSKPSCRASLTYNYHIILIDVVLNDHVFEYKRMPFHRTCVTSPPPFPSREHCCDPTSDHIFSIQNNKPRCALYMNSVGILHVSEAVPTCILFVRISLVMRIICTFCFRARAIPH